MLADEKRGGGVGEYFAFLYMRSKDVQYNRPIVPLSGL